MLTMRTEHVHAYSRVVLRFCSNHVLRLPFVYIGAVRCKAVVLLIFIHIHTPSLTLKAAPYVCRIK